MLMSGQKWEKWKSGKTYKNKLFPNVALEPQEFGKSGKVFRLYYIYTHIFILRFFLPPKFLKSQKCFPLFPILRAARDRCGKSLKKQLFRVFQFSQVKKICIVLKNDLPLRKFF